MGQLDDRVVIITGGGRNIGQAYAKRVSEEGAKVVVCDVVDCSETEELIKQAGGEVLSLQVDVTQEDQTIEMARRTVERFGRIDGLVNNAAIFHGLTFQPIDKVDMAEWDRVYEVNCKGLMLCCRAVYPYMREQMSGKIINIGSGIFVRGVPGLVHYVSSKAAVMGITRSLSKELGNYNINVNTLSPGGTDSGAVLTMDEDLPPMKSREARALDRPEVPEDLTGTVVFLLSSNSDFITGQMLVVNGGDVLY